jgi:gliding motility-associated-like protein
MKQRILLTLTLLVSCYQIFAQDFSNKGKDFWLGYGYHIRYITGNPVNQQEMVLYFATESVTNIKVEIPSLGYVATYNNVPANTIFTSNPIPKTGAQDARLTSEGISNKGIHITADKPVVAYTHIYNASVSGATLLFPTNTLGKEYYSINFTQYSNEANSNCYFFVVAVDTGTTTVEVKPTANTQSMVAGGTYNFQLTQGQILNVMGTTTGNNGVDLTGSTIKSISSGGAGCKRIAVFSGSGKININCPLAPSNSSADNYIVQAFPKSAWGKRYLTTPAQNYNRNYYRVCVSDPTAIVKLNGTTLTGLVGNFYYQFENNTPNYIESDKPIMVAQYIPSQGQCSGTGNGDPEVIYLSPIEQNINKVILNSTNNFQIGSHFINVTIPTNGVNSFRLDGISTTTNFVVHPQLTGYSYGRIPVSAGVHTIQSDSGFNAIAYGFGPAETYGYNAGANVLDLYQYVTIQNQFASINFPATCKGTPFNYAITLPYQPLSLNWNFNNNPNQSPNTTVVNNSPVADSSFVRDGRTLYVYKLPGNYLFSASGTYPVKVTVNNPTSDGCSGLQEISYDVVVFDKPAADFNYTHTGCLTDTLYFTDATNGFGRQVIKWNWEFGDGSIDSVRNPKKRYATAQTYPVKLTAITDIGCLADTIKNVIISEKPISKFGSSLPKCIGKPITFTDSSTISVGTIVEWKWYFPGGIVMTNSTNAPVTQSFPVVGSYTVSLVVKSNSGCKDSTAQTFVIHPNPVPDFSLPIVCLPVGAASFTNLSTISDGTQTQFGYQWFFGDGGTATTAAPTHNYSSTGPFDVKLIVTSVNGCIDSTTKNLTTVYAQPKADFTATTEVCLRDTTVFTDASNGFGSAVVRWRWDFGDGTTDTIQNPRHLYATADTFTVKLFMYTDKGCISDTMTKEVIVHPLPSPDFSTSLPSCETKQVTITNLTNPNVGTSTNWYWDFGDATTANLTNGNPFPKTYTTWGDYYIRLATINSKGCKSDTVSKPIRVNPQPEVGFILPEVCLTDAFALFTDTSSIADNSQSQFTYLWNFGDPNATMANPNTSTLRNPQHKYSAIGLYPVKLTVTSKDNCVDTLTQVITVNGAIPVADFAVLNNSALCSNLPVQIQNTSTVDFGTITKVQIIWDNLNAPATIFTDDMPTPNKIYSNIYPDFQTPASKTYQVRFIAYSGGSCLDDVIKTITVHASPKVSFQTMPGICFEATPRQITQATESGFVTGGFLFTGNGVSPTGLFNPATAGVGTHNIQYLYTSNMGCRDSATKPITVWPSPTAVWGYSNPTCERNGISFSDTSVANFSNIVQWQWNFGDGNTSNNNSGATFVKTYATAGNYNAILRVLTDSGCISLPVAKTIAVHPLPIVNFSLPSICLPDGNGQFNDASTIADGSQLLFNYNWSFGDGGTSAQQNPIHRYFALGPYNVKLIITTNNNCVDSLTKSLTTVYPQPKADFTFNPNEVCLGDDFAFTDISNGMNGTVTKWRWNFDDGTTDTVRNPVKLYSTDRTYNVSLHIYNSLGCVSDTMVKPLTVHPYPTVNAGPDLFVLEGGNTILQPVATGNDLSFAWSPSLYLDSANIKNPRSTPLADITYTITVTGRGNCAVDDDVFVKVLLAPSIPNAFSPNADGINDVWNIKYLESYPGCTIEVFDRSGASIFRSEGYTKPWDGTVKGKPLPVGTYYYIVNPKNGRKQIAGSVTILK